MYTAHASLSRAQSALHGGDVSASQNRDIGSEVGLCTCARDDAVSGSSAIPGPGSGSGPGSSGMAWTASGSVSALACFAGWLLALLFSVGPAPLRAAGHALEVLQREKNCKAVYFCSLAGFALHVLSLRYPVVLQDRKSAGREHCAPCASRLAAMARIRSSSIALPPQSPSPQKRAHAAHPHSGTPVPDPAQHPGLRTWLDSQDLSCSLVSMHTQKVCTHSRNVGCHGALSQVRTFPAAAQA